MAERLPADPRVAAIRGELGEERSTPVGDPAGIVAVQCLEDPFYLGIFGAIARHLADHDATSELVIVRSISSAIGNGWRERIMRSNLVGMLTLRKWIRAFSEPVGRIGYRSLSLRHPLGDALDWFRSRWLWRRVRGTSDLSALRIQGLLVGDLIIDSYLRFRPAPRFEASDPFVARLIWQVFRDIRRARRYFRSRRPALYLTSYTTYIEHGIPVRVALEEGVQVRAFGSLVNFGKLLTEADWFHTPDCSAYRTTFQTLDAQSRRLDEAEQQLRTRLSGGIDAATSYMRVSAYASTTEPLPRVADVVVIFLHDFYDSPHVYADLVFPDFWSWVTFTIDTLTQAGVELVVKPHPNQIALSSEVLAELRAKYPGLRMLSARNTNSQLAAAGIRCGITVYGTVAHELAYLGIPTIGCARHPHHAFGFCRTARSIDEYRQLLLSTEVMPLSAAQMRRQALEFYYMHNLYGDTESLALRQRYIAFWKAAGDRATPPEVIRRELNSLCSSAAFRSQVGRMVAHISAAHRVTALAEAQ